MTKLTGIILLLGSALLGAFLFFKTPTAEKNTPDVTSQRTAPDTAEQEASAVSEITDKETATPVSKEKNLSPENSNSSSLVTIISKVSMNNNLRRLGISLPNHVLQLINRLELQAAVIELRELSANGSQDADVALYELHEICNNYSRYDENDFNAGHENIKQLSNNMPHEDQEHLISTHKSITDRQGQISNQCQQIEFNSEQIKSKLEAAALDGHPTSLWLSAQHQNKEELEQRLEQAAESNHAQALFQLSGHYIRSDNKQLSNKGFEYLHRAAELNHDYKHALANCYASGCYGEPDEEAANYWYQQAAQYGTNSGVQAYARRLRDQGDYIEAYAWEVFHQQLNEEGCYGYIYPWNYIHHQTTVKEHSNSLTPYDFSQAEEASQQLIDSYGQQARQNLGCTNE